jgi:hypothetical protein
MQLVYLSPVAWASFAQRPHKFVQWFHDQGGGEVLWIDPYPTRLPSWKDFGRKKGELSNTGASQPSWLQVVQPKALPIEPLPGSGLINRWLWDEVLRQAVTFLAQKPCVLGIGKPSELGIQLLAHVPQTFSFYDAMDDFPFFYHGLSHRAMVRREREIISRMSKVLVSSSALFRRLSIYHREIVMALNACAVETLPAYTGVGPQSEDYVLGYVGTIGKWFDWDLVFSLARANPTNRIRLIGPVYSPPAGRVPDNVEMLPACDHATAIMAMGQFAVGLIPFKRTPLTASVDPIKYYEYRALGLPVITTGFGEMALRGHEPGVVLIDEQSDLTVAVAKALAYQPTRDEVQQFRTENSWEARFAATGILS